MVESKALGSDRICWIRRLRHSRITDAGVDFRFISARKIRLSVLGLMIQDQPANPHEVAELFWIVRLGPFLMAGDPSADIPGKCRSGE